MTNDCVNFFSTEFFELMYAAPAEEMSLQNGVQAGESLLGYYDGTDDGKKSLSNLFISSFFCFVLIPSFAILL